MKGQAIERGHGPGRGTWLVIIALLSLAAFFYVRAVTTAPPDAAAVEATRSSTAVNTASDAAQTAPDPATPTSVSALEPDQPAVAMRPLPADQMLLLLDIFAPEMLTDRDGTPTSRTRQRDGSAQ